jgi:hypothetical protein
MLEREEIDDEHIGIKDYIEKFTDDLLVITKDILEFVRENCREVI